MSVGLGAGHYGVADPSPRTASIFNDHAASKLLGQIGSDRAAREICRTAGRKWNDDGDRTCGPTLLGPRRINAPRPAGTDEWKPEGTFEQFTPIQHQFPPRYRSRRSFLVPPLASRRYSAWLAPESTPLYAGHRARREPE